MTSLTEISVSEMRAGLKAGKFSSEELTKAHLELINKTKNLNSFVSLREEAALKEARDADKILKNNDGVLLGVPVALKDIIHLEGERTTCASKMLKDFTAPYSATVTNKLKSAGAIIVGKTNMDEFAMGSSNEHSYFGPVRNPWDTDRVPGGSSGGSAVAVASGQVPLSLGTDTGGSIRQPASLCGIVGLKPTYGRVSRYGVVAFASSLDQVGTFARNVEDCALISQVISGHDRFDSTSVSQSVPNWMEDIKGGIKGLKIGLPKEYFIDGIEPSVKDAVMKSVKKLTELGAEVVEVSLPHTELALSVYYIIAPAEASSNLARFDGIRYGHRADGTKDLLELYSKSRAEGFGSEVKRRIMVGTYVLSSGYFDAYYIKAQKVRTLIAKDFSDAFANKCDVIACPAAPTTAFKLNEKVDDPLSMYLNDVFTIPVNLAGLPGLVVPCGLDYQGLPVGLQLIGKPFDEGSLLKVAYNYEQNCDWNKKVPVKIK